MDVLTTRSFFSGSEFSVLNAIQRLHEDDYFLQSAGKVVKLEDVKPTDLFQIHFRVLGGKGGFGSLLRSFRIHRSTNQLMCRNLSGRRLADVKEEERLKKWVAKSGEREKEKQKKKKEKYEKLKNGGPKHDFADVTYLRQRDVVLDRTEDAIEAGVSSLPCPQKNVAKEEAPASDSDSDIDMEGFVRVARKRKMVESKENIAECKPKILKKDVTKTPTAIKVTVEVKPNESKKSKQKSNTAKPEEPLTFDAVDLDDFVDVDSVKELGLLHLKHALESRGLKCGGTLEERASRLFSVKGLTAEQYPKKICAMKK